MKKIKLDSSKLQLKKESIGNLLNKDFMKQIKGGLVAPLASGKKNDITCDTGTLCNATHDGGTAC